MINKELGMTKMTDKELEAIAEKIVELEKKPYSRKVMEEMQSIADNLSMGDMLAIDAYIMEANLLTK